MRIKRSVACFFSVVVLPPITIAILSYFGGRAIWGERGILACSDRLAKYSQLLRIEGQLGDTAVYAGRSVLRS